MQGSELTQILKKNGIDIKFMNTIDSNTTLKRDIIWMENKLLVDFEKVIKGGKPTNENLEYHKYDLILLSDYNKGVLIVNGLKLNLKILLLIQRKMIFFLF